MHKLIKIILHLFFWIIYCLLAAAISFELEEGTEYVLRHREVFVINLIWAILAFYFVYLFGYRFFEQRKYVAYFGIVSLVSILLTSLFYSLYAYALDDFYTITPNLYYTSLPGTFIIANCGSLLKGFIAWFDAGRIQTELEKRSLQHELESLKSQINPHFLFNTLNNIDSLILIEPQQASASLLKLSDILRYMLYSTEKPTINLSQEIKHIENIIELQNLRLANVDFVHFSNEITHPGIQIAPLIFTPFIENAFKYVVNQGALPAIEIALTNSNSELSFRCRNYYDPQKQNNTSGTGGIGLTNVQRRLNLLYPEKHALQITKENNTFEIKLTLTTP
ncbi:MAG: sensor histidine kinase [Marinilabiliaceae bacterium]|nr:sensor histidine kinase [Marinilabiliaceae bacterium]